MFNFLTYNKLKTYKWKKLSPKRRIKVFQKIENIMARKQSRKPFFIQVKNWNDGTRGMCFYDRETIYLHQEFFTEHNMQFMGLATLFHEERHICQHNIVENKKNTKSKFFKFSKAYKWQQNMQGYINYDDSEKYSYYSMQEIERDANKFAINQLKKFKIRFRFDEIYLRTLRLKQQEYNDVKENAKKELGLFYRLRLYKRLKKERKKNK